jgi:hypothetical protein
MHLPQFTASVDAVGAPAQPPADRGTNVQGFDPPFLPGSCTAAVHSDGCGSSVRPPPTGHQTPLRVTAEVELR